MICGEFGLGKVAFYCTMAPRGARSISTLLSMLSSAETRHPMALHLAVTSSSLPGGAVRCASSHSAIHWQKSLNSRYTKETVFSPIPCRMQLTFTAHNQLLLSTSIHTSAHAGVLLSPSRAVRAKLMSTEGARDFVDSLNSHQRKQLLISLDELRGKEEDAGVAKERLGVRDDKAEVEVAPPTWIQLRLLCYQQALPFLGFGFLDNFVMITVGEYIDLHIGAMFTISTMAAAGLGNLISDLAGLGLADRVEALCRVIGIPNPRLSSAQLHYRSSRWMGLLGRCLGITIGCLLGMVPLLWFDHQHKRGKTETQTQETQATQSSNSQET